MNPMAAYIARERDGAFAIAPEALPVPEPGPLELLVAVHAAAITRGELAWSSTDPRVPSHEFSGVIVKAGGGVSAATTHREGDEVFGLVPFGARGAAAEFVVVPANAVAAKPGGVSHVEAASLALAALTAHQALVRHANVTAAAHVLVHGGAGGVGNYAVQIAHALGARVSATAAARDAGYVHALGADVVVDYTTPFEYYIEDVDVVIDTVGDDVLERSWQLLNPGGCGIAVTAPLPPGTPGRDDVRGEFFRAEPDADTLRAIAGLVADGRLKPQVGRELPIERIPEAFAALAWEHVRGKLVLTVR